MELIPNYNYGKKKGIKTSWEKRTEQLLHEVQIKNISEETKIYHFKYYQEREETTREIIKGVYTIRTQRVRYEDTFYSKDRDKLYNHFMILLVRFGSTNVVWLETVFEIDKNIENKIDTRILHTYIDTKTKKEITIGYVYEAL